MYAITIAQQMLLLPCCWCQDAALVNFADTLRGVHMRPSSLRLQILHRSTNKAKAQHAEPQKIISGE